MKCRHCGTELIHKFLDLGFSPPSNAYLAEDDLSKPERYYPLKVMVCDECWLVQTEDYADAGDLFNSEYAYFSSTSKGFLVHASSYVRKITQELALNTKSLVVEIASNDGYLLKNFVSAGIPCLGIEPTASTAAAAEKLGIPVLREFFGKQLAQELSNDGSQADLIVGNNVYAHVPDINDFTQGLKILLKDQGTITLEFPHLMQLLRHTQFDTVYHEHFSYLSLYTVKKIFETSGLRVFDVEQLSTHGGSLRVYGCHSNDDRDTSSNVIDMIKNEIKDGMQHLSTYLAFQATADKVKDRLLSFLIEQKKLNKTVVAYGAAAKGNTILNYAGIKPDLLCFVFDAADAKQGKYMPGSHIPILSPSKLNFDSIDFVLILPWNIADEVKKQLNESGVDDVKYVTAIPELKVY